MIVAPERIFRQEIFQSIRSSIQELHSDKVILEDVGGAPFLFKSKDAQVWARIFYRSMRDCSVEELQQEIRKLWVLMPNDAVLYLFFPELDPRQILKMNGLNDRLSFFEYGGMVHEKTGIRICKWMPSWVQKVDVPEKSETRPRAPVAPLDFLRASCLTPQEISGLSELSLSLFRRC
jgi:hypothetical protein